MKSRNNKSIVFALVLALVASLGILAACSNGGTAPAASSSASEETSAAAEAQDAAEEATAEDANEQAATESEEAATSADDGEANTSAATAAAGAAKQISAADIETYCGMCHFKDVENMAISSWNKTNIDHAMVESMVPMLDDETIQGIVDYFAAIEPPADEGGQH